MNKIFRLSLNLVLAVIIMIAIFYMLGNKQQEEINYIYVNF